MASGSADSDFYQRVVDTCPDMLCVYDLTERRVVWCNDAAPSVIGYRPEEVTGATDQVLAQVLDESGRAALLAAARQVKGKADGDLVWVRLEVPSGDGGRRWLSGRMSPFERDSRGEVTRLLLVARDVTHVVEAENRLSRQTLRDPFTGLANRALIDDRLKAALNRVARGGSVGLLFCDLDHFKAVNDEHGHRAGDQVLRTVAERMRQCVRPSDTVGRLGGDEFVLITESDGDVMPVVEAIKERIQCELAVPISVGTAQVTVRASIGVGIARDHGDPDELLDAADAAMYADKRQRAGCLSLGTPA